MKPWIKDQSVDFDGKMEIRKDVKQNLNNTIIKKREDFWAYAKLAKSANMAQNFISSQKLVWGIKTQNLCKFAETS